MDSSASIVVQAGWKGYNMWKGGATWGGKEVRTITLLYKNRLSNICMIVPQNVSWTIPTGLQFTENKDKQFNSIELTLEKINSLSLKASICASDARTKKILEIEVDFTVKMPESINTGMTYNLIVFSDKNLNLSAQLIPAKK